MSQKKHIFVSPEPVKNASYEAFYDFLKQSESLSPLGCYNALFMVLCHRLPVMMEYAISELSNMVGINTTNLASVTEEMDF
jgi:hypothetical protein